MYNQILPKSMISFAQGTVQTDNKRYFAKQNTSQSSCQNGNKSIFKKKQKSTLTKLQKQGIYASTAIGIIGSILLLAKTSKKKYSLNMRSILNTPLKDTFMGGESYNVKEITTIGAGSCIGGLIGGRIFDKDKSNFQAKVRETLIQYTNISLPIVTVAMFSKVGKFIQKAMPKHLATGNKAEKMLFATPKILSALAGVGVGMVVGNKASNKLNQAIFKSKDQRPIELGDFSAHLDDICMASSYISQDNILVKSASRFIPFALMVAGTEIGCKQEDIQNKK